MELQKAIETRRSVRAFTERKVTKNEIEAILRAGTMAPSACNMQSWHFYVICDDSQREKLKEVCAEWVSQAPCVILICTDENGIVSRFGDRGRKFPMQDTALAMENMLLKAVDLGLGGCIIGAYKQEAVTELFNIPKEHTVVALMPIGEPASETAPTGRKRIKEVAEYIGSEPAESFRKTEGKKEVFKLKKASLRNAEFEDLDLADSKFNNSNLTGSVFKNVTLGDTSFSDMFFGNAKFSNMNLGGSSFQTGSMDGAKIGGCEECERKGIACIQMRKANFDNVDMKESQLNHVNLEGSTLTDIRFCNALIYDVDFDGTKFSGVNMVGAELKCVNLFGSDIENTNLTNAVIKNCDISGLTIDGVNVEEAIKAYRRQN